MMAEDKDRQSARLEYEGFEPAEEMLRETLTSTGNGYFCTRGAAEWRDLEEGVHYPGTYAHGVFNRETTILGGRPVLNEDLVNLPNWLLLKPMIEGEEPMTRDTIELLSYRHWLELDADLLVRELRWKDRSGRITSLRSRRFVSMRRMHQAGICWDLTPENWSGKVTVLSGLDGRVVNRGVDRYKALQGRHMDPQGPRVWGDTVIGLKIRTRQSRIEVAEAARTMVYRGDDPIDVTRETFQMEDYIHQLVTFDVEQGQTTRVEKMVALFTSHDRAITEPLTTAGKNAERYGRFDAELELSAQAWDELWELCDLTLPGDERVQYLMRLHISHLLQTCSRFTSHQDAGVPARGLNGEAYRGHIFWDEIYVLPFLNFRMPEVTKGLLMYRFRRLGEARAAARELGLSGAMFPWQSGSDGQEETQVVHLNPLSGQWDPDLSRNQRHVNAAIFYNIWNYFQATEDLEFLRDCGAEMMLEIARFWSSLAHFNPERDRWEIHGVMGPDEFHEKYPGSDEGGLHNNAYTNVMVAWICETAQYVVHLLPLSRRTALMAKIGLTDEEIGRWSEMSRKMYVPFLDNGVIAQFEGYDKLEELDWAAYREKYGNIQRLDRILKAEGSDPDYFQLSKQADAVMLFYLFPEQELQRLFTNLGYDYAPDIAQRTIEFYDQRTSHGSTLSFVTHAGVLAAIDPDSSWERFKVALESDVGDIQGGTTREGIHLGVMTGTLNLIQQSFLGTDVRHGVLHINPTQIERLDGLHTRLNFRGAPLRVSLSGGMLTVAHELEGRSPTIRIANGDEIHHLLPGDRRTFDLTTRPEGAQGARGFAAAIFDVDGLLVDSPHERAWRSTMQELMENEWQDIAAATSYSPEAFTSEIYKAEVAGKPRRHGALAALRHFNVPDAEERAEEFAERKHAAVVELIEEGKFDAFGDALRFLLALKGQGVQVAVASSSKNAELLLRRVRVDTFAAENGLQYYFLRPGLTLSDVVDVNISGRDFAKGKPHPEIFLTAAAELGVPQADCLVLEDSAAGVHAAKSGGMSAVGVARAQDGHLLGEADLVVESLDDIDLDALMHRRLTTLSDPDRR